MATQSIKKNPLSLLSLNVRGLGSCAKTSSLFHWLRKYHDVQNKLVFLQETHVTKEKESKWKKVWPGKKIFTLRLSPVKLDSCLDIPKCVSVSLTCTEPTTFPFC